MADDASANMPLSGITVLDLGQVYQGPYATMLMARAGADVIKVEPVDGEPVRRRSAVSKGAMLPLAMLNANKRGITLNLKSSEGRRLLLKLAARADVLLENFAPGVMNGLGVGWEALHAVNPRLIYASGSGFGLSGPDRETLAMDLTVQAVSGAMSVTGFPDGPPLKSGPAFVDFLSGTHLYGAVLTALFERTRTGKGRLVEVAMIETVYPALASNLSLLHGAAGAVTTRTGNRHGGLAIAPYNVYPAGDGHVAILCIKEAHWSNLLRAMGRDDLAGDPRFSTNALRVRNLEATDQVVEAWTAARTRAEIFAAIKQFRIPCAPVRDLEEVMNDPHMHERGMLERVDHPELGPVVLPTSPLRIHGAERPATVPSPLLGQHNDEIYGDMLGLTAAEIAALRRGGVI
ncbi:CoA transferase [Emcibacter sp. SYSU 3D8]|uniref:CaiB/BaiF CoA transferase family protein n=1 Tax=Emcibacter sp. SYSU 3D8 TaxID=3133969 RepID=UPI0031FF2B01